MKKFSLKFCVVLIGSLLVCCSNKTDSLVIKTGDLIFRGNSDVGLSEAINKVTQTEKSTNYSHIGICFVSNDSVWVYHAAPEKGVCKELLDAFLKPDSDVSYNADLYRVNTSLKYAAAKAAIEANKYIGLPYDYTYILESPGFYCSEFIYELFKEEEVFVLNPMTFKNEGESEFNSIWIEHYKNLGVEIPEGKLGCNPNGMAASSNIFFVKNIQ